MEAQRAGRPPRFGILGPLQVLGRDGRPVPLGGPRARELLAALLLHPNRPMSTGRLVLALWGESPSDGAATTLRTHVAAVRRVLASAGAADTLDTGAGGYTLTLDAADLDAEVFERLVLRGQEALALGDPAQAAAALEEALALRRGELLCDLGPPDFAEATAARLGELAVVAEETAMAAALALGRHGEVAGRLRQLVAAHPFRERLCGQLMLALYRSGRQAEALATYAETRDRLAEELGLDPGPELRDLETAMLRQDPALLLPAPPLDPGPGPDPGCPGDDATRARPDQPIDAVLAALQRTPMVGRTAQLDRVCGVWADVLAGGSALLAVSGPAGIGKSRLAAHLAHRVSQDGGSTLVGRCEDLTPYSPLVSALVGVPAVEDLLASAPEGVREALRPLLSWDTAPSSTTGPERGRRWAGTVQTLAHGVAWLAAGLVRRRPLLLVIEDAERMDESTSVLLGHLVDRMPPRLLLAVCYRDPPGSRHPPLGSLLSRGVARELVQRVSLAPLDREGLRDLAAATDPATAEDAAGRGGVTPVPDALVEGLWERTGGNPFFARELLRDLDPGQRRTGRLSREVPAGVSDVLRHRLRALPQATREAVAAAAVLGREVELTLLTELTDASEEETVAALDVTVASGLLVEGGRSWAGGYAFAHELVRDAVYADIPVPRRQRLHLRAVDALLAGAPTDADVVAAAIHASQAGPAADPRETVRLLQRASAVAESRCGRQQESPGAAARYGFEEAVRLAEATLPLLGRFAAPAEQADAAVAVARLRLRAGRGYDRAVDLLDEALATYLRLGDREAAGRVHGRLGAILSLPHPGMDVVGSLEHFDAAERLLEAPEGIFQLQRARMSAAMHALDSDTLGRAADRCAALAPAAAHPGVAVSAAGWGHGWRALNLGRPGAALARLEEAWSAVRDLGDPMQGWPPSNAAALICTVYLLDPSEGRAWCRRGLSQPRFDALAHPHDALVDQLVLALAETGELDAARRAVDALPDQAVGGRQVRFLLGAWEQAAGEWQDALARDLAAGDRHDAVLNARWLAEALLALGDEPAAAAALRQGLRIAADAPQVPTELWLRARLAMLPSTPPEDAAAQVARCEKVLAEGEDWRGLRGHIMAGRAAARARHGDLPGAEAALAEAVSTFAAYRLPWRHAEALRQWGQLLAAAGREEEALALRRKALAVLDRIGAPDRWRDLNVTSTWPTHG